MALRVVRGKTLPLILLKTVLRNLVLPPASLLLLGFLGLALLKRRPTLARRASDKDLRWDNRDHEGDRRPQPGAVTDRLQQRRLDQPSV